VSHGSNSTDGRQQLRLLPEYPGSKIMTTSFINIVARVALPLLMGSTATGADTFDRHARPDHQIVMAELAGDVADMGFDSKPAATKAEPDPTDAGSIIVECTALAPVAPAGVHFVSMPQNPIGPSKCSPQDSWQWR
jgi:hypothetical protein